MKNYWQSRNDKMSKLTNEPLNERTIEFERLNWYPRQYLSRSFILPVTRNVSRRTAILTLCFISTTLYRATIVPLIICLKIWVVNTTFWVAFTSPVVPLTWITTRPVNRMYTSRHKRHLQKRYYIFVHPNLIINSFGQENLSFIKISVLNLF